MMLPSFMDQEYKRRRYPTTIDHGSEVADYTAQPDEITIFGSAQPGTGETDLVNRSGAEIVYTVYAYPADVKDGDIVEVFGVEYTVNGEPERWRVGFMEHDVIRLSKWVDRG